MAVITRRTQTTGIRHRILIFLAAVWIAVSIAIGGSMIPNGDAVPPARAADAGEAAAQP